MIVTRKFEAEYCGDCPSAYGFDDYREIKKCYAALKKVYDNSKRYNFMICDFVDYIDDEDGEIRLLHISYDTVIENVVNKILKHYGVL